MSTTKEINEKMRSSLSDNDLRRYIPDILIIPYSELRHFRTIDQLLPNPIDYMVIHVAVDSFESGHWVSVFKRRAEKEIYFFDSYGYRVDKQLLFSKKQFRRILNQKYPHLSYLLNKALKTYKVYFNTFQYQSDNTDIATCGYWSIAFLKFCIQNNKSTENLLLGFYNYIVKISDDFKIKDYDYLVTALLN